MTSRRIPGQAEASADRATFPIEVGLHMGGDRVLPTARLRQPCHQSQERLCGRSRLRLRLHGAKLGHDLVVDGDFHTGSRISLDPPNQRRQLLARFTDREFHDGLQLNLLEMYSHVQFMSM